MVGQTSGAGFIASEEKTLRGKFTLDCPIMAGITIRMNLRTDSMEAKMGDFSERNERYGL